jgi:uncharacterized membrane protein YhaH (DUF805 family)
MLAVIVILVGCNLTAIGKSRGGFWANRYLNASLLIFTAVLSLVFLIMAAVKVSRGEEGPPWFVVFLPFWFMILVYTIFLLIAVCVKLCSKVAIKLAWRDIVIYVTVVTVIMATSIMLVERLDGGDDDGSGRPVSIIVLPLDVGLAVLILMCIVLCCCCSVKGGGRGGSGGVLGLRPSGGSRRGGGELTEPLHGAEGEEDLGLPDVPSKPFITDTNVPL